jgi:hypothetical protein
MHHVGFETMQELMKLPATFAAGELQQGSGRARQAVDGGP